MNQGTPLALLQSSNPPRWQPAPSDVGETRLWLEEHDWLYGVLKDDRNVSPSFRFPDLISACVALVLADAAGPERIFRFLATELVLRSAQTPRRKESMWRSQYTLLQDLQRSPANRHPSWLLDAFADTI